MLMHVSGEKFFFFFSSRRRHTRWNCDWSSDVCSSDLRVTGTARAPVFMSGERYCTRTTSPGGAAQGMGGREQVKAAAGIVAHRPYEVKSPACWRRFRSVSGMGTRAMRSNPLWETFFRENGVILPRLKSKVPGTDGLLRR